MLINQLSKFKNSLEHFSFSINTKQLDKLQLVIIWTEGFSSRPFCSGCVLVLLVAGQYEYTEL